MAKGTPSVPFTNSIRQIGTEAIFSDEGNEYKVELRIEEEGDDRTGEAKGRTYTEDEGAKGRKGEDQQ